MLSGKRGKVNKRTQPSFLGSTSADGRRHNSGVPGIGEISKGIRTGAKERMLPGKRCKLNKRTQPSFLGSISAVSRGHNSGVLR